MKLRARAAKAAVWMDGQGWGWRQWVFQALMVTVTVAGVVPVVAASAGR
ncbi:MULTISPECIES: hypothetical protein [Streptomyces]|nr:MULTISPECIES: hypothetical protein [unclassified Streptomyces]MCY0940180.1 hypothetical protein [Streptomyces sp. H34-AA3]MCZ4080827.1 hypothetical protein [Streptomyces sp. H34-S5]